MGVNTGRGEAGAVEGMESWMARSHRYGGRTCATTGLYGNGKWQFVLGASRSGSADRKLRAGHRRDRASTTIAASSQTAWSSVEIALSNGRRLSVDVRVDGVALRLL